MNPTTRSKTVQQVVDWADQEEHSDRFYLATLSAINGAWDDIRKGLRQEHISLKEANKITRKLHETGLIDNFMLDSHLRQFKDVVAERKK